MCEKINTAAEKFSRGLNCAQAVLCAYSDKLKLPEEELKLISKSFGGGKVVKCGAVYAAEIVLSNKDGLKNTDTLFDDSIETKEKISEFEKKFIEMNEVLDCIELKKCKKPCINCIKDSVKILEEML